MSSRRITSITLVVLMPTAGCNFHVNVGGGSAADRGPDVVLQGEAIEDAERGCIYWRARDGREFTLYQDVKLDNDEFDAVVTPGTPSRIMLRTDRTLGPSCRPSAAVALVRQILRIGGVDVEPPAESRLTALWREFESALEDASSAVHDKVQDFADNLRTRAEGFRDEVSQAIEEKKDAILAKLPSGDGSLSDAIDGAIANVRERVQDRIDDIRNNLELGGDGFLADLRQAASNLRERFEDGVKGLEQKLQDRAEELGDELEARREQLAERLDELKETLRDRFETGIENLRSRLEQRLRNQLEDWADRILAIVDRLPDRIDPDLPDLGDRLPDITEGILDDTDDELNVLIEQRDEIVADLAIELTNLTTDLQTTMDTELADIEADLLPDE